MARTHYSMGLLDAQESWRGIHSLRADPPGSLRTVLQRDHSRLETFHSALEQAEQQFSAATRVGYESRPLNLFYGLSQAGRAIAAASMHLGEGEWRASGHGVRFRVPLSEPLLDSIVRVAPASRDLFSRVSTALGSPQRVHTVPIADLLSQIPDYWMEFQDPPPVKRPLSAPQFDADTTFPSEHGVDIPDVSREDRGDLRAIESYVKSYPALEPLQIATDDSGAPMWLGSRLRFQVSENDVERARQGMRLKGTVSYRRKAFLIPAVRGGFALEPIPAWWLLLFALSMLARYAPDDWTRVMDLRQSKIAARIEFVLDAALDAIPELVLEALENPIR